MRVSGNVQAAARMARSEREGRVEGAHAAAALPVQKNVMRVCVCACVCVCVSLRHGHECE